jgi:EAL domain-containing protein (putative c-di-GMP-specific phosphodiesterase class I)
VYEALAPFRRRGARLAIDDAGANYASMRHILNLKADIIKLDISLTRDIDSDSNRRALAKGLIAFAREVANHCRGRRDRERVGDTARDRRRQGTGRYPG